MKSAVCVCMYILNSEETLFLHNVHIDNMNVNYKHTVAQSFAILGHTKVYELDGG